MERYMLGSDYNYLVDVPPYKEYSVSLYYDHELNLFKDDDGFWVFDLFTYITPDDLYLFKKWSNSDEPMVVMHATDSRAIVELYYPILKEDKKDESQFNIGCCAGLIDGRRCKFSHIETDSRKEICAACGGRDH